MRCRDPRPARVPGCAGSRSLEELELAGGMSSAVSVEYPRRRSSRCGRHSSPPAAQVIPVLHRVRERRRIGSCRDPGRATVELQSVSSRASWRPPRSPARQARSAERRSGSAKMRQRRPTAARASRQSPPGRCRCLRRTSHRQTSASGDSPIAAGLGRVLGLGRRRRRRRVRAVCPPPRRRPDAVPDPGPVEHQCGNAPHCRACARSAVDRAPVDLTAGPLGRFFDRAPQLVLAHHRDSTFCPAITRLNTGAE